MKKILFMAVSAILLAAGCQKTEIQNEKLTPIGFDTHMGKLTKAPNASNTEVVTNLYEQGFQVWSYFAGPENDLNYEVNEPYFDEGSITVTVADRTVTPATWATEETYYWPGKGKELDLYAVSSYKEDYDLTAAGNVKVDPVNRVVYIKDFVVDADADNDLMVAAMIRQDQDDAKFVKPHFQHALTKVLVKFRRTKDCEVYLVSATTSEINSTASLKVTNSVPPTVAEGGNGTALVSNATFEWTGHTTPATYGAQCAEPTTELEGVIMENGNVQTVTGLVQLNAATEAVKEGEEIVTSATDGYITYGSWLLLPQDSIKGYYLDVQYIVDGYFISQQFKLDTGVSAWSRNQQTTYNVTISPDYIEFEPDVKDWVENGETLNEEENLIS